MSYSDFTLLLLILKARLFFKDRREVTSLSADFYSYNRESGKRNSGLLSTLFGYIDINAGFLLET